MLNVQARRTVFLARLVRFTLNLHMRPRLPPILPPKTLHCSFRAFECTRTNQPITPRRRTIHTHAFACSTPPLPHPPIFVLPLPSLSAKCRPALQLRHPSPSTPPSHAASVPCTSLQPRAVHAPVHSRRRTRQLQCLPPPALPGGPLQRWSLSISWTPRVLQGAGGKGCGVCSLPYSSRCGKGCGCQRWWGWRLPTPDRVLLRGSAREGDALPREGTCARGGPADAGVVRPSDQDGCAAARRGGRGGCGRAGVVGVRWGT